MSLKIATLNLCLGFKNTKNDVNRLINEHSIDILCLQESEVEASFKENILSFKNYQLELDNNSVKSTTGIYIPL